MTTASTTNPEVVHLEVAAGIATITLDSPRNRNALSAQLRWELITRLQSAIADTAVRAIVLTHTGTVFCAGMDLKEARGAGLGDQNADEVPQILATLWDSPTPVIARLCGPARAGGVGIVAACDVAIAADDATFAFSEVRIGVVPAMISVTVLPRLLPRAAHELFLTGETVDEERAAAIGLLNRAVPDDAVDQEVDRIVDMLRLGAPGALAGTKHLLQGERVASISADLAAMNGLSARFFASDEGQEGMAAFGEKRRPRRGVEVAGAVS